MSGRLSFIFNAVEWLSRPTRDSSFTWNVGPCQVTSGTSRAAPSSVAGSRTEPELLKFDIRLYTYDGKVQWTAARLYQGQTTNFRTPGGGFAPVYSIANDDQVFQLAREASS